MVQIREERKTTWWKKGSVLLQSDNESILVQRAWSCQVA